MGAPRNWPEWHISARADAQLDTAAVLDELTDTRAVAVLNGGGIARIDRATSTTVLTLPAPPTAQALLHPHLAITALVAAHWLGRRTFHAGSFVTAGGVWAVLGDREAGKSTSLAWLAMHGVQVFADDLLVLAGDTALAGPRLLDLRPGAAAQFGIGRDLGVVGTRPRWRVDLEDVPAELPFRGFVDLQWADDGASSALDEVPARDRLARLVAARGLLIDEPSTAAWLPILSKPMLALRRPRDWGRIEEAMTLLLSGVSQL